MKCYKILENYYEKNNAKPENIFKIISLINSWIRYEEPAKPENIEKNIQWIQEDVNNWLFANSRRFNMFKSDLKIVCDFCDISDMPEINNRR